MSMRTDLRPGPGGSPAADPDAERDIDLRRFWDGLKRQWWVIGAGVVAGIILGVYTATARIAPGQAFNTTGQPVQTYLTNLDAINAIATSETTIEQAAARLRIPPAKLRRKVSVTGVTPLGGSTTNPRSTVLVEITVRQPKKKRAEDAADTIANIVKRTTTSRYVRKSLSIYQSRIDNFYERLKTLQQRIDFLDKALAQPGLTLDQKLLLAIQLDQAQATQGQTTDSLTNAQQQQILAQDVQQTQIIQRARGSKSTARSRRTSVIVGALLGLIVGVIAALVVDRRAQAARTA
jgi:capsular polysaccharide biosynthesis protein